MGPQPCHQATTMDLRAVSLLTLLTLSQPAPSEGSTTPVTPQCSTKKCSSHRTGWMCSDRDKGNCVANTDFCETTPVPAPSLLTSDSVYDFYKVPISHGVEMVTAPVDGVCKTAGMNTVCLNKNINFSFNVEKCITMARPKNSDSMSDISTLICNTIYPQRCSELHGVFSATKGLSK